MEENGKRFMEIFYFDLKENIFHGSIREITFVNY